MMRNLCSSVIMEKQKIILKNVSVCSCVLISKGCTLIRKKISKWKKNPTNLQRLWFYGETSSGKRNRLSLCLNTLSVAQDGTLTWQQCKNKDALLIGTVNLYLMSPPVMKSIHSRCLNVFNFYFRKIVFCKNCAWIYHLYQWFPTGRSLDLLGSPLGLQFYV